MSKLITFLVASAMSLFSTFAMAMPDGAKIATEINKANAPVDSAGTAFIAVALTAAAFAIVIGMIWRKGR